MRRIASPDCVLVIALLVTLLSSLGPIASGVAQAAQNPEPVGQPGGATDAVASSAPGAVRVTRVSVATSGQQGNAESGTFWAVVSDNGRYVAFSPLASNLVADDTNGVYDAFLSDTLLGTTESGHSCLRWCPGLRPLRRRTHWHSHRTLDTSLSVFDTD